MGRVKTTVDVLQSSSLRDLVDQINRVNASDPSNPILKEDILTTIKDEGTYFLVYYK